MRLGIKLNIFFTIIAVFSWGVFLGNKISSKDNTLSSESVYNAVERLESVCWVRALRKLEEIKEDPSIVGANMVLGYQYEDFRGGHAWIEYIQKIEDEYITIEYDPTFDKEVRRKNDLEFLKMEE